MPTPQTIAIIVVVCVAITLFFHWLTLKLLAWRGVTVQRTKFGLALLFDTQDQDGTPVRMLNVNGTFQSACYLVPALQDELVCVYHRSFAEVAQALPRLRRAAVIGGGGFSFPKWLVSHLKPVHVDAVEIDPKIIEIARESFGLSRSEHDGAERLNVVCADGWEWLKAQTEPFELIVNDAFSGKQPLGPLATDEGAKLIHAHLAPGGTYLANVRAPLEGKASKTLYETRDIFAAEFAHVWLIPEAPEEPKRLGNNVLIASDSDLDIEVEQTGRRSFLKCDAKRED